MFDCPGQIELYNHLSVFKTFVNYLRNEGWSVAVVYCLDAHFITDVSGSTEATLVVARQLAGVTPVVAAGICHMCCGVCALKLLHLRHDMHAGLFMAVAASHSIKPDTASNLTQPAAKQLSSPSADARPLCFLLLLPRRQVSKFISGAMQALSAMVKLELPHINVLTKMDICENRGEVEEFLVPEPRALLGKLASSTGPAFARLNRSVASLLEEFSLVSFVPLDITDEESLGEVLAHVDNAIQYGEDAEVKARDLEVGGGMGAADDD